MKSIKVSNLGPIGEADIQLGDLTIFVGPQASGKSLLLQTIKLVQDHYWMKSTLKQYSFYWSADAHDNLELVFGEGMGNVWTSKTECALDGVPFNLKDMGNPNEAMDGGARVYFIPAQRILALSEGRAKFFTEWDGVPWVLRAFGESLRAQLENVFTAEGERYPNQGDPSPDRRSMHALLEGEYNKAIYYGGKLFMDHAGGKKRLKMRLPDGTPLPFSQWSSGQKEFSPLRIAFNELITFSNNRPVPGTRTVIIEEPEMGLHPQAIITVMLNVVLLVAFGYKVIISTHSPIVMEFAWACKFIVLGEGKVKDISDLFGVKSDANIESEFNRFLSKDIRTYFFDKTKGKTIVRDISTLDAGDEDPAVAEWGGISSFVDQAGNIVAKVMSRNF